MRVENQYVEAIGESFCRGKHPIHSSTFTLRDVDYSTVAERHGSEEIDKLQIEIIESRSARKRDPRPDVRILRKVSHGGERDFTDEAAIGFIKYQHYPHAGD